MPAASSSARRRAALFKQMRMPYTEALLAAIPKLDAAPHTPLPAISGRPPDPTRPLQGLLLRAALPLCDRAAASSEKPALAERGIGGSPIRLLPSDRDRGGCWRMMHGTRPSRLRRAAARRSRTSSSSTPSAARSFTPSPASAFRSRAARRWAWSAESGCGKSTLGRAVLQLRRPDIGPGAVRRQRSDARCSGEALRKMRRRVQLIFQDPIASLNPRRRIGDIVAEPLVIAGVKDPEQAQAAGLRRARARSASIPAW